MTSLFVSNIALYKLAYYSVQIDNSINQMKSTYFDTESRNFDPFGKANA